MATATPDTTVADAINRVLDAEREAAAAIAAAEAEAETVLQAAREQRRQLLERARDRSSRLHVRAESRIEAALAELDAQSRSGRDSAGSLDSLARQAIDALARRLTSDDHD
jgi:cell division septum initiation protein DivIVA